MLILQQAWQDVRSSFWFLPGLIVLVAIGLAGGLVEVEPRFGQALSEGWPRLFGASAAGARSLLSTVASSMVTVAGVVFSITLVALSLTSSQYTSRVLRNFMDNRINQTVLGVFVGIFAYCLVVLRAVRDGGADTVFVPSLAVLFGLLLALLGIAVLIYYIHHISKSIQAVEILAVVAAETIASVDRLFPEGVGDEGEGAPPRLNEADRQWHAMPADRTGYVQSLDAEGMLALAASLGTVLRMERAIGEFVIEGTPLASMCGPAAPDADVVRRLVRLYTVGTQRTVEQDAAFGIRQIVDIALKALSPGINDTTTAVMCVDYLTAILVRLTDRRIESPCRAEDGSLRILARGPTYGGLVGDTFDQIRQNAAGNMAVLAHLLEALELLASRTTSTLRLRVLADHARAVMELGDRSLPAPRDRARFDALAARVVAGLGADAAG